MENETYREKEKPADFENRKRDHVRIALQESVQASGFLSFDNIQLIHEALPDLDFDEVILDTFALGQARRTPFLISSMTAGHQDSGRLNGIFAKAASARGWMMGVGSQRRELSDPSALSEWVALRKAVPNVSILGNLGLAQVLQTSSAQVQKLVDALQAEAMIVHLNVLQESLQLEGDTRFKGGLSAIARLCRDLPVPVVVKETGCGLSTATARRLDEAGVAAIDVSGLGGTHWGRIEGERSRESTQAKAHRYAEMAHSFAGWGIPTVESLKNVVELQPKAEVWASGGVRTGLDAYKALVMGARVVGLAKPLLASALQGEDELYECMEKIEHECRIAMLCTGQAGLEGVATKGLWQWHRK